jgi:uncharacterized protein
MVVLLFLIVWLPANAQQPAQAATSKPGTAQAAAGDSKKPAATQDAGDTQTKKMDAAKEADIRRLLDVAGTRQMMTDSLESMTTSIRPLMTRALPAGEYREKLVDLFFLKFKAKIDLEHLLEIAVGVYDKHFSHEEIKGLIKFYESPLGQKASSLLPQISNEMRVAGEKWGEVLGRQSMNEVLAEHPDLAEALEAAGKAGQSK